MTEGCVNPCSFPSGSTSCGSWRLFRIFLTQSHERKNRRETKMAPCIEEGSLLSNFALPSSCHNAVSMAWDALGVTKSSNVSYPCQNIPQTICIRTFIDRKMGGMVGNLVSSSLTQSPNAAIAEGVFPLLAFVQPFLRKGQTPHHGPRAFSTPGPP